MTASQVDSVQMTQSMSQSMIEEVLAIEDQANTQATERASDYEQSVTEKENLLLGFNKMTLNNNNVNENETLLIENNNNLNHHLNNQNGKTVMDPASPQSPASDLLIEDSVTNGHDKSSIDKKL